MSTARSSQRRVRNPLVGLPSADAIRELPPVARAALRSLLLDMRDDARVRAERSWLQNKGPMAAYWKAVSVYAWHASRLAR